MFEALTNIGRHAILQYGLSGLFLFSFASSTIFFPTSVEWAFPIALMAGVSKHMILASATLGAVLGAFLNYFVGYGGEVLASKYLRKTDLDKAHRLMNRYGWAGLFAALVLPLPGDPLTIICGITRMNRWEFAAVVASAKALKYYLILEALSVVIR